MHRFFFDVTDIMRYVKTETSISGIQRVTLEIIRGMLARTGSDRVRLCYWDPRAGQYLACDAGFVATMAGFDADLLAAAFYGGRVRPVDGVAPMLARYRTNRLKYRFHHTVATLQALRGNARYFEKRGSSLAGWRAARGRHRAAVPAAARPRITLRREPLSGLVAPGDRIIQLGAGWGIDGLDACLTELARQQGARVTLLIHDLIPLRVPEHVPARLPEAFRRWLLQSADYCDHYLANSEQTARDLRAFMAGTGTARPVTVIPLAQQAVRPAARLQPVPAVADRPFVLAVGSMEPRKNLGRLVQAWTRLAGEPGLDLPQLVLAGKRSPDNTAFNDWLAQGGAAGAPVHIVDRPSDAELAWLYENCLFTAMVSLYEGWGLPIGESLAFGKTAVVADNSSMPEVGGDMVAYCDAGSVDSIAAACRRLIAEPDHRAALEARIAQTRLRTWEDVTADIIAHLERDLT